VEDDRTLGPTGRQKATGNSELIPQTAELTEGDAFVNAAQRLAFGDHQRCRLRRLF
jgi:hypothetical protein